MSCKAVLGGESLCTGSVSEAVVSGSDDAVMTAPDEADVGTGGVAVEASGCKSCESGGVC